VADLEDYLDLTVNQARDQYSSLKARRPVPGRRQVTFLPVETLLFRGEAVGLATALIDRPKESAEPSSGSTAPAQSIQVEASRRDSPPHP